MANDEVTKVSPPASVKSADRTLSVLEYLAQNSHAGLPEIANALNIPKSSLHGLLRTMTARGWVATEVTGTRFSLGVRALQVGTAYVESDKVVSRAQNILDWLSDELHETVHLGRLDGSDVVYLDKRESQHQLRMHSALGKRLPAHAVSLGKAVLAEYSPSEVRARLGENLVALTPHTITDMDQLLEDLARTHERGYSFEREENTIGTACFAIALPGPGPIVDAVSVALPLVRLDQELQERVISSLQTARQSYSPPSTWGR